MSFLKKVLFFRKAGNQKRTIRALRSPLQTHLKTDIYKIQLISPKIKKTQLNIEISKRISSGILHPRRGSLTVEAALAVPLFLFALAAVLSFLDILRLQIHMDASLAAIAKEMSVYAYAVDSAQDLLSGNQEMQTDGLGNLGGTVFSQLYVKGAIKKRLGEDYLSSSPMGNTERLHFIGSKLLEKDRIELRAQYLVKPYFSLSPKTGFINGSTAIVHAFTGYDNLLAAVNSQSEEYVFITPNGMVYHRDRGCHYLDLSISSVYRQNVAGLRNADGSIYYSCPLCGNQGGDAVYITNYGTSFHTDPLCPGLRRTVEMIPISQTGSRTPCSKCG